nr:SDR family NAD(P)-dependent oxidoreductase [Hyphomicrobiales bacterium]
MIDLNDKTILVTGGSKGIGAEIVRALGAGDASVIVHYGSDRAGAEAAAADIPADRKHFVPADLSDASAVPALWDAAVAWRGQVDVVVNNAAIMLWHGGMEAADAAWDEVWSETLKVNVLAPAKL